MKHTPGTELSKYVYLASMGVKINQTDGGQNQELFSKCISIVMPVENGPQPKKKNVNIYAFIHRNVMVYTEN